MKSVFRTTVTTTAGSQITQHVLAQPGTDLLAMVVALEAAVASQSGSVGVSVDKVGDVNFDATAGGTGPVIFFSSQVRSPNGQFQPVNVLSNAIATPATPALIRAITALTALGEVQSIHQQATIDIDATV
jgi:hypothetical protein